MNSVDTRPPFFPNSRTAKRDGAKAASLKQTKFLKQNSPERAKQLSAQTREDARVAIPNGVRDFSKIKSAVDAAPPMDNSAKIASLRQQISAGTYNMDYDAMADKILAEEF